MPPKPNDKKRSNLDNEGGRKKEAKLKERPTTPETPEQDRKTAKTLSVT